MSVFIKKSRVQWGKVEFRVIYIDSSKSGLMDNWFYPEANYCMVEGVKKQALEMQVIEEEMWER